MLVLLGGQFVFCSAEIIIILNNGLAYFSVIVACEEKNK